MSLRQRYINRDGIYSRNSGTLRFSLHSTNTALPTFSFVSDNISELMVIGRELMMKNSFDELYLVDQDTLAYYHIRRSGGDYKVKIEQGIDVEGPLYGVNLNSSY